MSRSIQQLLVTGGAGFIGSNFIQYLLGPESGFDGRVINLDKLTYAGNPMNLDGLDAARYRFYQGDICDREILREIMTREPVDAICHFAAESHVDRSIDAPGEFIQTNLLGTYHLLECLREHQDRIQLFHHISTDEVYGSLGDEGLFTETTPYAPNSPYSASKAGSDHLVRAWVKTFGLPITLSNCSNNYGPFQFPEKLVPLMILNALEGKPLPVYGDGRQVRDWLYVDDHCRAIWAIMQHGEAGGMWNVGGRNELQNLDVVRGLADAVDERADPLDRPRRELITFVKDRPGHDQRYAIDCSKIEAELGWTPRESFESGLARTVDWYLSHPDWVEQVRSGAYRKWMERQYGPAKGA